MKTFYKNGAIVVEAGLFDKIEYQVSNQQISAVFDGKGGLPEYALSNKKKYEFESYVNFFYNGEPLQNCIKKTVVMIGRIQTINIEFVGGVIIIKQFLDKGINGVFSSFEYLGSGKVQVGYCYGGNDNFCTDDNRAFYNKRNAFISSVDCDYVQDNYGIYFDLTDKVNIFQAYGLSVVFAKKCIDNFSKYLLGCEKEIKSVKLPKGNLSEEEKALFYSAFFCSLENYKVKGKYKAFMAGRNYLLPMRTYYRDSFFTVLPMYNGHKDKVKNQILTLSRGIEKDGTCPSSVAYGYKPNWGNHYDSPSFFVIMLYDYVRATGDKNILNNKIDSSSIYELAGFVVDKLSTFADDTSLIYKAGKYNRRDWADEVNRYGYVTFDNVLYARALFSMAKLARIQCEDEISEKYYVKFEKVKNAINDILWDENLGYYINFINQDYTEKNLSIDTVFATIFGIANKERSMKVLKNMENILETRNNPNLYGEDFGVMCVYPFYSNRFGAFNKSSCPYFYHNGSNWPYLSAMYAYAKKKHGMEYKYALESWFDCNVKKGNYTPIEFFSSLQPHGSLLQAWSGVSAFVMFDEKCEFWD